MSRHKVHRCKGFTLIELMVVVAIIGILSSIALPLFKGYQVRTKKVEGKLILANVHTALQAFYLEYDVFASCLNLMGIDRVPNGYFSFGFTEHSVGVVNAPAVANGAPAACNTDTSDDTFFFQGARAVQTASAPTRAQMSAALTSFRTSGNLYVIGTQAFLGEGLATYDSGWTNMAYAQTSFTSAFVLIGTVGFKGILEFSGDGAQTTAVENGVPAYCSEHCSSMPMGCLECTMLY